jgi:acyl carrier protein
VQLPPSIPEFVVATISAACGVEPATVGPDTNLDELGLDSLGVAALAAHIEAAYGCVIGPIQLSELIAALVVGDLVAIVRQIAAQT